MGVKTTYTVEFGGEDRDGAEYTRVVTVVDPAVDDNLVLLIDDIFSGEYSTVEVLSVHQDTEVSAECPICGEPFGDCTCFPDSDRLMYYQQDMAARGMTMNASSAANPATSASASGTSTSRTGLRVT
jgi:hypothetical protein